MYIPNNTSSFLFPIRFSRQHHYSKLFQTTQTCQQANDELLNVSQSTSVLDS